MPSACSSPSRNAELAFGLLTKEIARTPDGPGASDKDLFDLTAAEE